MPKFAANLTMLFNEVEFLDRFEAAARAGFRGVEFLFPYPYPREQLAERLQAHGLVQVLHNLPAGDWSAGDRGIACHPDRVGEFQDGVGRAIEYARALGCPRLNCLAGLAPPGVDPARVRETFVANLRFAAREVAILERLAQQAVVAIQNARLYEQQRVAARVAERQRAQAAGQPQKIDGHGGGPAIAAPGLHALHGLGGGRPPMRVPAGPGPAVPDSGGEEKKGEKEA